MKKILLTCFEPFGNINTNSSYEVVKRLNIPGIIKETIPVIYDTILYQDLINKHQPDIILLCGQALGRSFVEIEKVALNFQYANTPDNRGVKKLGEKILEEGPDALFGTIPTLELVNELKDEYPLRLSLSAGGYICNMSYYVTLHLCQGLDKQVGFIHFPAYESQIENSPYPSLKLEVMEKTLTKIIYSLLTK